VSSGLGVRDRGLHELERYPAAKRNAASGQRLVNEEVCPRTDVLDMVLRKADVQKEEACRCSGPGRNPRKE
jgi:hypothetical protein